MTEDKDPKIDDSAESLKRIAEEEKKAGVVDQQAAVSAKEAQDRAS